MVSEPVLYLDTNHISRLVRDRDSAAVVDTVVLLESGNIRLAYTVLHLLELSDPDFKDRGTVGQLLDRLPLAWGMDPMSLLSTEIDAQISAAAGEVSAVDPFHTTMEDGWDAPPAAVVRPSRGIEVFATTPHLRQGMLKSKAYGAALDGLVKRTAAVVEEPLRPLLSKIREEHDLTRTQAGGPIDPPLTPEALVEAAGGIDGFPANRAYRDLYLTRLNDPTYRTQGNDIIDELHCVYGPYVSALLVDRTTLGRIRSTQVPFASWSGRKLEDVRGILKV